MNPTFLLAHRNRYLEEMDDRQKTPRGHPDINSYVKNLHVLVFQTDGWRDRQTDKEIHLLLVGWGNFFPVVLLLCQFFGSGGK
jgi:hypothetical protein